MKYYKELIDAHIECNQEKINKYAMLFCNELFNGKKKIDGLTYDEMLEKIGYKEVEKVKVKVK